MKIKISKTDHFPTTIQFLLKKGKDRLPDFKAEPGEITVRYNDKKTVIYSGLGEEKALSSALLRTASAKAVQKAIDLKRDNLSLILPAAAETIDNGKQAIIEGIVLGSYKFDKYKSEKSHRIQTIEIVGSMNGSDLHKTITVCDAVNYARDLVNDNASVVTPDLLVKKAVELGKNDILKITVLKEKDLERKGLGLIGAVGQGASIPPRLVFMEYKGSPGKHKTALIGKGITFDSGGQNLKPTGSIETMREDMAGAAAVLGTMKALADLKPSINVIGCIACAQNAIGNRSFFPGDIYRSYSGKTVEIHSTDAEGRLVLADAAAYCQAVFQPSQIIDLATLTGGILTALGEYVAGLFSNNDELARKLFQSGEVTNERLWRFPLYKEYSDSLKGELGDLRNLSKFKKGYASSITGAAFIQEFIGNIPWAHLDIAGTSFNESGTRGEIPQYGTGFGVRLLIDFLVRNKRELEI